MEKETLNEIGNALLDLCQSIIASVNPIAGITTEVIIKAFEAKNRVFANKLKSYLEQLDKLSTRDAEDFSQQLAAKKEDDLVFILTSIDQTLEKDSIVYQANATASYLMRHISSNEFKRICIALKTTIKPDLEFSANNINKHDLRYHARLQSLSQSGIWYISGVSNGGEQLYSPTLLGHLVDQYAVSVSDTERYPDPKKRSYETMRLNYRFDDSTFYERSEPTISWKEM